MDMVRNCEIRFRAIRVDNGEWIYGNYSKETEYGYLWLKTRYYIVCGEKSYEVVDDTVGQYIGQESVDGKSVYEGDILKIGRKRGVVTYYPEYASFVLSYRDLMGAHLDYLDMGIVNGSKIIGNIVENPELVSDTIDILE